MPNKIEHLTAERDALLAQLQSIDRLRRGTLSQQVYSRKEGGADHTQGPYFVLQGFHQGKKFSQRITAAHAEQVQQQVNNYKRFQQLTDQCISITDQLTQLVEAQPENKKNSSQQRSKAPVSRKPKRS